MRRVGRIRRRPDHWASPHERARLRAAERLAGELGPGETAWLETHLAECAACAGLAAQYDADRLALRALRDAMPEPPRDLWARTSSAIEEASGAQPSPSRQPGGTGSRFPLGALSGIAVIVLVVGVSALSGGVRTPVPMVTADAATDQRSTTGGDSGSGPGGALATPFAVGAGPVEWVDTGADGRMAYNKSAVDEVCPAEGASGCPALEREAGQRLTLESTPRTIIKSPADGSTMVVADDGSGGDQILLVALPEGTPDPGTAGSATPVPTPSATAAVTPPPTARASASSPPVASPAPSAPVATPTAAPSDAIASVSPDGAPGTDTSGSEPTPTPVAPLLSPAPSVATTLAIARDIELVGDSAAFSGDGTWFAFTARPADGSRGPDVYVWRVGDESARALTGDGSTVFASWDGNLVVASRPGETTNAGSAVAPMTVRIAPVTGEESPAGDVWRPVVDPTRSRAIGWTGTLERSADGTTWTPAEGTLEMRGWSPAGARRIGDGQQHDEARVVADTAAAGFDVRWDETGEWVAVWVADVSDPGVGRLSLYRVSPGRGQLELSDGAPAGVPALPGFSIGDGRLAWATPPGQDGEGSRIQIVAWNDDGVGTIETAPGEDLIVVR